MHKFYSTSFAILLSLLSVSVLNPPFAAAENPLGNWVGGVQSQSQTQSVRQENLKYTPTLSYIPTYTGRNFINTESVHFSGLPTGDCYNLKFLMKEDPATVMFWYTQALRQVGWTIDSSSMTGNSLSASQQNGLNCFVYSRPAQKSGYACELVLRYSIRPNHTL